MEAIAESNQVKLNLEKRIRELNCLYDISNLVQRPQISIKKILQGVVDLIPASLQYPEITCSRIILEDQEFKTKNFKESICKQTCNIVVLGEQVGSLEIHYSEKKPESEKDIFLEEEKDLIDAICARLGKIIERKRTREDFIRIFNISLDMLCVIGMDGYFKRLNPASEKILGYSKGELLTKQFMGLVHPDDKVESIAEFKKLVAGIPTNQLENRYRCKDKSYKWMSWTSVPVVQDNLAYVVGRDITESKQAKKRIKHLNRVLMAIRNVNQLITWERDRDILLEKTCAMLTETNGYINAWIMLFDESGTFVSAFESGVGKNFQPIIDRLKRGRLIKCAREALSKSPIVVTKSPKDCVGCPLATLHNGKIAEMAIRLDYGEKVYGLISVCMPVEFVEDKEELMLFREIAGDIAFALYVIEMEEERKLIEKRLVENEEKYRLLVSNQPDVIFTTNREGAIAFISPNVKNLFGYTQKEIYEGGNDLWFGRIHRDDIKIVKKEFDNLFKKGMLYDAEYRIKHKDGHWLWLHGKATVVYEKNNITYCDGILTDITKRKQVDEELKKYRNSLENMVEERTLELTKSIRQLHNEIIERKRVENDLKISKRKYSTVVDNSPDIIYLLDSKGVFIFVGGAVESILGFTPSELIGKHFSFIIFPGDIEKARLRFNERRTGDRATKNFDVRLVTKKGKKDPFNVSTMIVEINAFGICDDYTYIAEKKTFGTYGLARNITMRKQTEEALRVSQEKYQNLFANALVGLYRIKIPDGTILECNKQTAQLLGYDNPKNIIDKLAAKNYFADEKEYKKFQNALSKNTKVDNIEAQMKRKDGSIFWANYSARMFSKRNYIEGVIRDISARKSAEEQLLRSKKMLQTLFDGISEPLIMLDKSLKIKMLNNGAMKYCQVFNFEKIIGKHCFAVLRGRKSPCKGCKALLAISDGQEKKFEQKIPLFPDRFEQIEIYPIKKSIVGITGAIIRMSDITEKRKIEEQLVRADRLSSLGQLSGGIAHEIRNPLSSIKLFVDILSNTKKFKRTDDELDILGDVADNVNRISEIIKRVLNFAKLPSTSQNIIDLTYSHG